ncbi:MAG TPA: signal recognition particle-docking protein FtsY [Candidatus Marinimicrobia bacterium]|nr:signal recognition particle-docking protein FtsY [Candidatus Neomarinimicrobiota bacterium]
MGFFSKKKSETEASFIKGLERSRNRFKEGLLSLFGRESKVSDDFLDELEAFLFQSDLGTDSTDRLMEAIIAASRKKKIQNYEDVVKILNSELGKIFFKDELEIPIEKTSPFVIMVIGVNGAGKTTTIGKLAYRYRKEGKKVLIVAGDTYRAAAVEQLEKWAERAAVEIFKNAAAKNPSGLIFDGIQSGLAKKMDLIIVDTAGRLHNRTQLMDELTKIDRTIKKLIPDAPHEALLVLDGTVGQNGLVQAQEFQKAVPITGLVITKLDGTAKGGIVIAIKEKLNIPVKFIGLGEKIEDLKAFDPELYLRGMFAENL